MNKKSYAILGTGRFGNYLAEMLAQYGHDVVVVDTDPSKLEVVESKVNKTIYGDITDEKVLTEIGIRNFDVVIVGSAQDVERNLMAATLCKELGCEKVLAKASTELHGKMLTKLGVDKVVYPDRDMARRLGRSLLSKSLLDYINVSEDFSIIEIIIPQDLVGKTIGELRLRDKHRVNVVLVRSCEGGVSIPNSTSPLCQESVLVVMGRNDDLERFQRAFSRGDD